MRRYLPDYERKVHLAHDNGGAEFQPGKKFADTLCKMNSTSSDMRVTDDPDKVTCKICRRDERFKRLIAEKWIPKPNINELYGKMASAYPLHMVNGHNARYRRNWRGKLILQVEVYGDERLETGSRWRDATLADLGGGVV